MSALQSEVISVGGGLVLDKDVFSTYSGAAKELINFEPDITGGYKKVLGTSLYNTNVVPFVVTDEERVMMTALFNGVVLAARGGSIHRASSGSGSWTSLITGLGTPTQNYEFRAFNFDGTDRIVICSGTSTPRVVDTSYTVTNVNATGSANFKYVEVFKNHIFFAGKPNNENELIFMSPFATNDFSTANGAGTIKIDSPILGLKVFREELYIFCNDEIFKLSGNSLADFVLRPVTRKIGCVDGRSIQEFGGNLIFLAPDGLRTVAGTDRIGDIELGTISKQVQSITETIGTHNINSVIIREKSQYRLFYPLTQDQAEANSLGLICVLKSDVRSGQLGYEYSQLRGLKPSCTDSQYVGSTETIVSGGYDGYVYLQESGNIFTRAATTSNINSFYKSPDLTLGDPGVRKIMQRVILNYEHAANVDTNFKLRYDFESSEVPQPQAYNVTLSGGTAIYSLDISTYGTAIYGSAVSKLARQSVEGSGFTVAIRFEDFSNNKPISLKGYELEFIPGGRR